MNNNKDWYNTYIFTDDYYTQEYKFAKQLVYNNNFKYFIELLNSGKFIK
jgi:hypothetical protein